MTAATLSDALRKAKVRCVFIRPHGYSPGGKNFQLICWTCGGVRDFRSLAVTSQRYLNRAHLEDPTGGCPSAALLPEIARQPLSTRKDYEKGLRSYVATLAALLPDADASASRRRATAIFGLMVGTLQFARAMPNATQAEQILEGGVEAALHLARAPSR